MLVVMRHGQVRWNNEGKMTSLTDLHLDELGHEQARQAASRHAHLSWDRVISSPLTRARETASYIRADHETSPLLTEFDFGLFEGWRGQDLLRSEHRELYLAWCRGEDVLHGGETWSQLQERCRQILHAYAPQVERCPHGTTRPEHILLVTHGYVIRTMACLVMQAPLSSVQNLRVDNTHMMALQFERGNVRMTGFNLAQLPH